MKRLLREPLVHFVILGILIFAAWGWKSKPSGNQPGMITISQGEIESMAVGFERTWRRPPTTDELDVLIRDRVREEVYSREAVALGMDKGDLIIRRRLRQKMEFLTDDVGALAEPTDAELQAYLDAHADTFRVERRYTFEHVYLNPEKHGDHIARDVAELQARLNRDGSKVDIDAAGDRFLLEHRFEAATAADIGKLFGEPFAAKLAALSLKQWCGPIESGYGTHLVFVSARTEGRVPALADVRDAVRREWANARRVETNEQLYASMLKRYVVKIDRSPAQVKVAAIEAK